MKPAILIIITYILMSFIEMGFNPYHWNIVTRIVFIIFVLVGIYFIDRNEKISRSITR